MLIPIGDEIKQNEVFMPISVMAVPNIDSRITISTWGRIYNGITGNILPKNTEYNKNHYVSVGVYDLFGNKLMVQPHRVLLMTVNYIPGCELLDVNHIDGIKYHNWIWNLEWNTRKENIDHAINTGLFNLGETRENSNITNDQANTICKLIQDGKSPSEIELITGIQGAAQISTNIKMGLSWKHISCNYDFSNAYSRFLFTDEQIHMICKAFELLGRDTSTKDILYMIKYDCSGKDMKKLNAAICAYRNKKNRKDICDLYDY